MTPDELRKLAEGLDEDDDYRASTAHAAASAWEADRKRLAALDARCSAPGVSIIAEDFIDNTVAWMEKYKEQRDGARKRLARLREAALDYLGSGLSIRAQFNLEGALDACDEPEVPAATP